MKNHYLKHLFKLLAAVLLLSVNFMAYAAASSDSGKWHPGIYIKIEDWQLMSPANMEDVYAELAANPKLRGIKVVLLWGRYESKDMSTGKITYNWSQIDQILSRLKTMTDKHLILTFSWREFDSRNGATLILPNDLRTGGSIWGAGTDWEHPKYDHLWAYKQSATPSPTPKYGYNIKLWKPWIINRINNFLKALSAHIDSDPNFNHISTTESALGDPLTSFAEEGGSDVLQYDGQVTVLRQLRANFVQSMVIPDFNYSRQNVATFVNNILQQEGFGLGTSNNNKAFGLTRTTPLDAPGVLTYFPTLSGKVVLAPEIQGEDFWRSAGPGTPDDYPPYDYLYNRVRCDLKANYVVIQRNFPFWLGGNIKDKDGNIIYVAPSMRDFLLTYPRIVNAGPVGGLNWAKPKSLSGVDPAPYAPAGCP